MDASDPTDPPKLQDGEKICEYLEGLKRWMNQVLGAAGVPLVYIVRDNVVPAPATATIAQRTELMPPHCPHAGSYYAADNAKV